MHEWRLDRRDSHGKQKRIRERACFLVHLRSLSHKSSHSLIDFFDMMQFNSALASARQSPVLAGFVDVSSSSWTINLEKEESR